MSELLKSNRRGVLPARGGGGEAGFVDPADDDGAFFGGAHAGGWAGEWAGEPNPPGTFEVSARASFSPPSRRSRQYGWIGDAHARVEYENTSTRLAAVQQRHDPAPLTRTV